MITIRRYPSRLAVSWVVLFFCATDVFGEAQLRDIATHWAQRAKENSRIAVSITRADRDLTDRLSLYQSHWVPASGGLHPRASSLRINGSRFRFDSMRWSMREHGVLPQYERTVLSDAGRPANPAKFLPALLSFFENAEAEFQEPHRFSRTFDGHELRDNWHPSGTFYPRVTIHKPLQRGSQAWALLTSEPDSSHQIDSLILAAAMLALDPLNQAIVGSNVNYMENRSTTRIAGALCHTLRETGDGETPATRTLYVDASRDFVVRRFVGVFGDRRTQIDIQYRDDLSPISWTVMSHQTSDDQPVRAWARMSVTVERAPSRLPVLSIPDIEDGSWVVDDKRSTQYLVRGNKKRTVGEEDLIWQPSYTDLLNTDPGGVRQLLAARGRWRSIRTAAMKNAVKTAPVWPVLVIGLLVLRRRGAHRRIAGA